jgi:acylphosphatase
MVEQKAQEVSMPPGRTPDGEALETTAFCLAEILGMDVNELIVIRQISKDKAMVSAVPCKTNFGTGFHTLLKGFAKNLRDGKEEAGHEQLKELAETLEEIVETKDKTLALTLTPYGEALRTTADFLNEETGISQDSLITIKSSGGIKAGVVTTPCRRNFGRVFQKEFKGFAKNLRDGEEEAGHEQLKELAETLEEIVESVIMPEEREDPDFVSALHTIVGDFADLIKINPKRLMRGYERFKYGQKLAGGRLKPTLENIGPQLYRKLIKVTRAFTQGGFGGGKGAIDYLALLTAVDDEEKMVELQLEKEKEDK